MNIIAKLSFGITANSLLKDVALGKDTWLLISSAKTAPHTSRSYFGICAAGRNLDGISAPRTIYRAR